LTPLSATRRRSRAPPAIEPLRPAVLGEPAGLCPPAGVAAVLSVLDVGEPLLALDAPLAAPAPEPLPNFAFFSTNPPPAALDAPAPCDALELGELLVELLLDPSPRCRHPVALVAPAPSVLELLCGVLDDGVWAASVPHSATALLSAAAHCQ
jgi:hypothetical protein